MKRYHVSKYRILAREDGKEFIVEGKWPLLGWIYKNSFRSLEEAQDCMEKAKINDNMKWRRVK